MIDAKPPKRNVFNIWDDTMTLAIGLLSICVFALGVEIVLQSDNAHKGLGFFLLGAGLAIMVWMIISLIMIFFNDDNAPMRKYYEIEHKLIGLLQMAQHDTARWEDDAQDNYQYGMVREIIQRFDEKIDTLATKDDLCAALKRIENNLRSKHEEWEITYGLKRE